MLRKHKQEASIILDKLLEAKADIYVYNVIQTPFSLAKGDTQLILRLLAADEELNAMPKEEKNKLVEMMSVSRPGFSDKIKENKKMIYETVGKVHAANTKCRLETLDILNSTCNFSGAPLGKIVLSYLFKEVTISPAITKFMEEEKKKEEKSQRVVVKPSSCVIA